MSLTDFQVAIRAYEDSPVWAARAFAFKQKHGYFCDACKAPGKVDAHHRDYGDTEHQFRGIEPDQDLRALCRPCHVLVHSLTRTHGGPMNLRDATDYVIRTHGGRRPLAASSTRGGMGWADAAWAWLAILYWVLFICGALWVAFHITAAWMVGGLIAAAGLGIIIGVALLRKSLR
jgi:hypothetical protein